MCVCVCVCVCVCARARECTSKNPSLPRGSKDPSLRHGLAKWSARAYVRVCARAYMCVQNIFTMDGDVLVGEHTVFGKTTTSRRYVKDGKLIIVSFTHACSCAQKRAHTRTQSVTHARTPNVKNIATQDSRIVYYP